MYLPKPSLVLVVHQSDKVIHREWDTQMNAYKAAVTKSLVIQVQTKKQR